MENLQKLKTKEQKIQKLVEIGKINLKNTLEILKWNVENDIKVYRFSSKLIPIATWQGFKWDYLELLKEDLKNVGDYIKKNNIRVSVHPDHFSVMNTPNEKILEATIVDLAYHANFLTAMGLDKRYKLVVHTGGVYGDKSYGKRNFVSNFQKLPQNIQKRITLENDDKSYTIKDVMEIHEELKIPIVLDVHHDRIHHEKEALSLDRINDIFDTWNSEYFPPKIHFSTSRNEKEKRTHADYIDQNEFAQFIQWVTPLKRDFDIMIEAKAKDLAVLKVRTKNSPYSNSNKSISLILGS